MMDRKLGAVLLAGLFIGLAFAPAGAGATTPSPDLQLLTSGAVTRTADGGAQTSRKRKKRKKFGRLVLRVGGLPAGSSAWVSIKGPRLGPRKKRRFHRTIRRVGVVKIRKAPVGRYVIRMAPVAVAADSGMIKAGATASPVWYSKAVRVSKGRKRTVDALYGTIVNPDVVTLDSEMLQVNGDPGNPSSIVVSGDASSLQGKILSAAPSDALPRGLLSRVDGVWFLGDRTALALSTASMYEAVPNYSADTVLTSYTRHKRVSLSCDTASASVDPYVEIQDVYMQGSWVTSNVLFGRITTGADVRLYLEVKTGVQINSSVGVNCSLNLPGFTVQGMAGPVPVYGEIAPGAEAAIQSSASIDAGVEVGVMLGAKVNSAPFKVTPHFVPYSTDADLEVEQSAGVTLGVKLDFQLGIGIGNVGNIHLSLVNSLNYTMDEKGCTWSLTLGKMGVGGTFGLVDVLWSLNDGFNKELFSDPDCAGAGPPPDPPNLRARISWNSDADIDLHDWDTDGNHAWYGGLYDIPDSYLVTDIIPDEGDYGNHAEEFYESTNFGRTYTVGVCLYGGNDSTVRVEVFDPDGNTRTFDVDLTYEDPGRVITVSPNGAVGFDPSPPPEDSDEWWDWESWCGSP